jgi:hypothetical protein
MTNAISRKEYDQIKNDRSYSVVSFEDRRRQSTYAGLTVTEAVKEVIRCQRIGREALIIRNLPNGEISWNRADYDKYLTEGDC